MNSRFYCVNSEGILIDGEGSKGRPFRLYFEKSKSPYTIVITDTAEGTEILRYTDCKTDVMLYYRLKDYYTLKITNPGMGKVKLL